MYHNFFSNFILNFENSSSILKFCHCRFLVFVFLAVLTTVQIQKNTSFPKIGTEKKKNKKAVHTVLLPGRKPLVWVRVIPRCSASSLLRVCCVLRSREGHMFAQLSQGDACLLSSLEGKEAPGAFMGRALCTHSWEDPLFQTASLQNYVCFRNELKIKLCFRWSYPVSSDLVRFR